MFNILEFDDLSNKLIQKESENHEYKNSIELELLKKDETIKILKIDLSDLKSKLDKAEEKHELELKHIIQSKGEMDLKDLELSSSLDIINNLRQTTMNLEQKLIENESKYNSNLDILEKMN